MVLRISCTAAKEVAALTAEATRDGACVTSPAADGPWEAPHPGRGWWGCATTLAFVSPAPFMFVLIRDLAVAPISVDGLDIGRMVPGALCGSRHNHLELVVNVSLGAAAVQSVPSSAATSPAPTSAAAEEETRFPSFWVVTPGDVPSNEGLGCLRVGPVPDRCIRPPATVLTLALRGN